MDFENRQKVQEWLQRLPQQVVVTFAARAALRTIPALAAGFGKGRLKGFGQSVAIPVFRAVSTAWVGAIQSNAILQSIAGPAATIAYRGGELTSNPRIRAAVAAASAAADCAADITEKGAASFAAAALFAAGKVSSSHSDSVQCDLEAFEEHISPITFATLPLWHRNIPVWERRSWAKLKQRLLEANENWDVWTGWYETRLAGSALDSKLEWERIALPAKAWERPPIEVNSQLRQLIVEHESNQLPTPVDNLPSPFAFQLSPQRTIVVASNPANYPIFPGATSQREHKVLLNVCQTLGRDLIDDLHAQRFQVREEYKRSLEKYVSRIPSQDHGGDILLADAEARTLRNLFAGEAEIIDIALAAKLKTFLEHHTGLRVYYPELENFYRHVQTGRLEVALPLDAVDRFIAGVKTFTPSVFDRSVSDAVEGSSAPLPVIQSIPESELPPPASNQLAPPKDPLGEVDPKTARDFTIAGVVNNLWKTFLQGEKVNKALDAWQGAGVLLRPHASTIITWLHEFLAGGGDIPPPPPTIGV